MSSERAIEDAVASVKMEGFQIDDEFVTWCKELLENKMNMEQFISLVKQKAEVTKKMSYSINSLTDAMKLIDFL